MTTDLFESGDNETELSADKIQGLIPSITKRSELNAIERLNINEARVWALRKKNLQRSDLLSDAFARDLHRRMFNQVWKWAGRYRSIAKNMGWEPHMISEAMRNLFQDVAASLEDETYDEAEMAVRMHHRLVVIHPWSNGNGRHARLMADIFVAAKGGAELRWGAGSNLAASGELRSRYIAALREADGGNFASLIAFAKS